MINTPTPTTTTPTTTTTTPTTTTSTSTTSTIPRALSTESMDSFTASLNRTGILYLSRIPPTLTPSKIKHLFSHYGTIGRVFFQPHDSSHHRTNRRNGTRKLYTEGWVEFMDKKVARVVAATLNNTPISTHKPKLIKKRSSPSPTSSSSSSSPSTTPHNDNNNKKKSKSVVFDDDLWTLKYLPRFKWIHLNEQLAYTRLQKQHKLRAETEKSKREVDAYMRQVDQSKMIKSMIKRRKLNMGDAAAAGEGGCEAQDGAARQEREMLKKRFKQRRVVEDETMALEGRSRLLSKLF